MAHDRSETPNATVAGAPWRGASAPLRYPPRVPTLSEAASKDLLRAYGVPVLAERVAGDADGAVAAAVDLGFPVVVKLCGDAIAHKTERGLVRLGLRDAVGVHDAAAELLAAARPDDGDVALLGRADGLRNA